MRRIARIVALSGLLLLCGLMLGTRVGSAADGLEVAIYRQVDPGPHVFLEDAIYASDHAVHMDVKWASPVDKNMSLTARWTTPLSEVLEFDRGQVVAGATFFTTGLLINGHVGPTDYGTWKVQLFAKGEETTVAEATFELKAPALSPDRPTLTGGALYWTDGKGNSLPTRVFAHDVHGFFVQARVEQALASGHRLIGTVYGEDGKSILTDRAKPLSSDGRDKEFVLDGWLIHGARWAQDGGKFTYKLFWDEDPRPILTLPFEIVTQKRWALLVCVEDYPPLGPNPSGRGDLPGVLRDGVAMYGLLTSGYGFPDARITVLANQYATREAVVATFERLHQEVGPDDAVVFYYSGHGTQIPDLSKDEDDGWDEAICTFAPEAVDADGRPNFVTTQDQLRHYLSDDEIAGLLSKLKTPNVTVIFDSCHSGTAVRDVTEFGGPPSLRRERSLDVEFAPELVARAQGEGTPDTGALDLDARYVFLAACRSSETSQGGPLGGVFTRALVRALEAAPGRSWTQALNQARADALVANPGQYATLEGGGRRIPFTLREVADTTPHVRPSIAVAGAVSRRDAEGGRSKAQGRPRLLTEGEAGSHVALVGIYGGAAIDTVGIPCVVYDVGALALAGDPRAGRILPRGRVRTLGTFIAPFIASSRAPGTYRQDAAHAVAVIESGRVQIGSRLVPLAVRRPDRHVYVTFHQGDAGRPTMDAKQAIARAVLAAPEIEEKPAHVGEPDYSIAILARDASSVVAEVAHPSGMAVGRALGTQAAVAAEIQKLVTSRHNRYARALRLTNLSPTFRFEAGLVGHSPIVRAGEKIKLRTVASQRCYVTALWVSSRKGIELSKGSLNVETEPGKPFELDLRISDKFKGQAMLKLVASTKPLALDGLESANPDATPDALFDALREAHGDAGQGAGYVSTEGWDTAAVWFRTE